MKKCTKKEIIENMYINHIGNLTEKDSNCEYKMFVDRDGNFQKKENEKTLAAIESEIEYDYNKLKKLLIFNELDKVVEIPEIDNLVSDVNFVLGRSFYR